ncbi:MAG: protein kinase [Terracidiphilus sp.]
MVSRASGQDLLVGMELGHYRIAEKIGSGGMGEVYRARDQHLARDVAIKVLPPGTLTDESARKHFRKEALILSQIIHPNIATIHDFDTQKDVDFLVMEYIPGITLSEKIAHPLPEKDVLRLGVQLAEGLAAVHERGVIHRDLKPSNVRIAGDGHLKILDFGLAWRRPADLGSATTESLSEAEAIGGTVLYMAPEQLLGDVVDARTDIHAAGLVLYEMATGQRPFGKLERPQVIAAILGQAPMLLRHFNPHLSPELERIIGKCLEKDPEDRYQSAKELAIDLRRLLAPGIVKAAEVSAVAGPTPIAEEHQPADAALSARSEKPPSGADPAALPGRSRRWAWAVLGSATVIAVLALPTWYLSRPLPPPRITEYSQIIRDTAGKSLVGTDGTRLFLNDWGNYTNPVLSNTIEQVAISGGAFQRIAAPLQRSRLQDVSADGTSLLIQSPDGLWSFTVPEGPLRFLRASPDAAASRSPDGKSMVYRTWEGKIGIARDDGSDAHILVPAKTPGDPRFLSLNFAWSPDGKTIRFTKDHKLWQMAPDGSGLHELLPEWQPSSWQCCGQWTPDGRFFLFLLQDPYPGWATPVSQLWALDERRGPLWRAPAEPIQLTSGPIRWNSPIPSKDGKKIFARGMILHGELVRFDAQSHQFLPFLGGISAESVAFSRDGQFVAYVTYPEGILWTANRDGSNQIQLTNFSLYPYNPRWSPDGARILFVADDRSGDNGWAYIVSSHGGTPQRIFPEDKEEEEDPSWSPDGRRIVFCRHTERTEILILDLATHQPTTLPGSADTSSPRWSPDGRFIAAFDSHSLKVFDLQTQRWSVLTKRAPNWPVFSRDGQFIYFLPGRPEDDPGVYRIRTSGGEVERVADTKGFHYTGWVGFWMGLDSTDAPILLRDAGSDDIYALTLEDK